MNMGFKKRRQLIVLEALDHARAQSYHFCTVWIAGMGLFTDAYNLFCIGVLARLLGRIYYTDDAFAQPGSLPIKVRAAVNGTALCGTLVGHLFFGWLGDKLGRKKVYGITLILMGTFSIGSGLSFGHTRASVMTTLCFMRFWLGFGIGGGYPLSATIMSEYANTTTRGAFIAAVFAMQSMGILTAGLVGMILAAICHTAYPAPVQPNSTVPQADYLWRIMFMLGAIPAFSTYYYRMRIPETARYTALVKGDAKKAAADMTKVLQVPELQLTEATMTINGDNKSENEGEGVNADQDNNYLLFSREFLRRHGFELLGTTTSWFLLDMVYYSQNLYQNQMFNDIAWLPGPDTVGMTAVRELFIVSRAQFVMVLCATVPGYWVTVVLVDRIGRRVIQLQGFLLMSVFLFVIANQYEHLTNRQGSSIIIVLMLYAGLFFFASFGPSTMTFIIPAEMFPARLRATCHGISAACGKAGAILGTFGFWYASQPKHEASIHPAGMGMKNTMYLLSATSILGAAFTFFLPETKRRSLELLSGEKDFSHEVGNEVSTHPNLGLVTGLQSFDEVSGTNSTFHSCMIKCTTNGNKRAK